uniref:Uncharacterized protein n=1 Tax=Chenopodium quinoa TaxID=63459 RepID=A0A803N779_CHEQI
MRRWLAAVTSEAATMKVVIRDCSAAISKVEHLNLVLTAIGDLLYFTFVEKLASHSPCIAELSFCVAPLCEVQSQESTGVLHALPNWWSMGSLIPYDVNSDSEVEDDGDVVNYSAHFVTDTVFLTFDDAVRWADVVAINLGFILVKSSFNKQRDGRPVRYLRCDRGRRSKPRDLENAIQKDTKTKGIGCPFYIKICYEFVTHTWVIRAKYDEKWGDELYDEDPLLSEEMASLVHDATNVVPEEHLNDGDEGDGDCSKILDKFHRLMNDAEEELFLGCKTF